MIAYGPVPSRRLGYSLGINNIPAKYYSYSCIYCQVGRTTQLTIERQEFYPVDQILSDVETKVTDCVKLDKKIDYLTIVPDGEPTLDINLGKLISELKQFDIPIAVISNASLIDRPDVQEELMGANWVSSKWTPWKKVFGRRSTDLTASCPWTKFRLECLTLEINFMESLQRKPCW